MTDRKRAEQRAEQLNQELSRLNDELQTRVDERTRDLEVSMKRLSVEEELSRQRADRLRELAGELTSSENKQRRELARLLHDHVQQLLVAAKQRIELAVDDVSDSARVGLKEALGILDQSITATRSLSVELDPPLLQEEGLVVALRWLAERMQRQHGLVIDLDLDENANPRVEAHRAILFQVAQELLLNVIKHSGTKQATLLLATRGQQNWLVVRDAGRGFDAELEGSNTGSYGLPHLRRRLESVGGCLVVESTPGGGTYAAATVPCPVLAAESQRRS
jgi:signal transduction histidine kinase